jgi:diguanylate cyclase (GGDEF)-like protein/PAS domain S-box-containing protein
MTKATVLVVEDEPMMATQIAYCLTKLGYHVPATVATGHDALEKTALFQPDLVLMDIRIEGNLDGIETAGHLREQWDIPIVYLTANADEPTLERAKSTGPYGYVLKPFEEHDLLATIEMALHKHAQEAALRQSEQRLTRILETTSDAILTVDGNGNIVSANAAAEQLLGLPRELITQRTHDHPAWDTMTIEGSSYPPEELPFAQVQRMGVAACGVVLTVGHPAGHRMVLSVNAAPLTDEKLNTLGAVMSLTDITDQLALQERLMHQAFHDALTGLPNRALFLNRLDHALARSERSDMEVALLFIDLDDFKSINDSMGHAMGDQLLVAVAQRLQLLMRSGDTAARLGGDEFTILIDNVVHPHQATHVAERILAAFDPPFILNGREVRVTPSIGIAFSHASGNDAGLLFRNADTAMYESKRHGKGCFQVYRQSLDELSLKRLNLENDLREALQREELILHYQPKIDLASNLVIGVEALVRWQHPTLGLVAPADFIGLAEETGLIVPIGRWILREACRQVRAWQTEGEPQQDLNICINISGSQLQLSEYLNCAQAPACSDIQEPALHFSPKLVPLHPLVVDVAVALSETGLPPHCLVLEFCEAVVMEQSRTTIEVLHALKSLGIRLAIDDFGKGFSSLSYLKSCPLDLLNIDRNFIAGLDLDKGDAALVASMISLGQALDLKVSAEGAETSAEVVRLRQLGCDQVQGFYFAKPLPAAAIMDYIKTKLPIPQTR